MPFAAVLAATAVLAASYEDPRPYQASKILKADLLKGPHHTIADEVQAPGQFFNFRIQSEYGDIGADGRTMLRSRLGEVDALARLSEVSKTEVFVKAAGGAVLDVGKGVAAAVKDPKATVQGMGAGVKRFGVNLGRKAKRTADDVAHDDDKKPAAPADASKTTEEKTADAAGRAASSVLGINGSARKWAQELKVDPYSTNPVLHKALVDIGKIDSAGAIVTKVVVPIPAPITATAKVGGLVWSADPEAVRKSNEAAFATLGVSKDVAGRFFRNENYTITAQTRFITALAAVKAKGAADYVESASQAADERDALFFVESAELLAGLHQSQPVTAMLEDSRAVCALSGTTAVVVLPFDTLRWTERLAQAATEIAGRAKQELGAAALEVRMSGQATTAARDGLAQAGWKLKEGVVAGLSIPPAD